MNVNFGFFRGKEPGPPCRQARRRLRRLRLTSARIPCHIIFRLPSILCRGNGAEEVVLGYPSGRSGNGCRKVDGHG